ncbi:pre-mRNA splicing factor CWC2 [Sporothrix brasiliensis 5110]|uniref:Pre-mRNA-splicing factor CWC2 n=1 Tax=Sporothrix brasiliensis 5110 TaxID=1398154 RepID=A0A0C2FFB7_9PEZI|nr:pre-mRNA splicing factor CWC2 [Sporothrix brasiliensis 5110]KIH89803.1 pre-mRNA splicing factor CWC2 [Sporothrix brasiliensis 5110]
MADVSSETAPAPAPTATGSRSPETNIPTDTATALATTTSAAGPEPTTAVEPLKGRKIIRRKRRPARPQVDPATFRTEPPPQTGVTFNIWYNKWSGGDRESGAASSTAAKGRCNVAKDSGYTLADNISVTDIFNPNVDCFGRDKFSDYRDDMGGVGSFLRPNRTIYIGRIHVSDDIEEVVARHFAEWGQIERTRVLNTRGVAFVTYTNEANAQFAKEAMAHQSLDHEEILNVRWATVDPNPMAQAREARRVEEQAAAAIRAILPADYIAELEGRDPDASKRRRIEGGFGLQGYEAPDAVWFARERADRESRDGGEAHARDDQAQGEQPQGQQLEAAPEEPPAARGVLSSATLAALARQRERSNGLVIKTAKEAKPAAALVDYGSDSDDDE